MTDRRGIVAKRVAGRDLVHMTTTEQLTTAPATVTRAQLREVYMSAFNDFAIGKDDVDAIVGRENTDRVLRVLEASGIVAVTEVNGSRKREDYAVQAMETYDSISERTARRRFDAAFPADWTMPAPRKTPRACENRQRPVRDQRAVLAVEVAKATEKGCTMQDIRDAAAKITKRAPVKFAGVQGYVPTQRFIKAVRVLHTAAS